MVKIVLQSTVGSWSHGNIVEYNASEKSHALLPSPPTVISIILL